MRLGGAKADNAIERMSGSVQGSGHVRLLFVSGIWNVTGLAIQQELTR